MTNWVEFQDSLKMDKCKKGKSCGSTCIQKDKNCIVDLPTYIGLSIRKVSKLLSLQIKEGRV